MYDTGIVDEIAATLVDLIGFFSGPQRVERLLREAEVDLDRALFPLLVCLAVHGPLSAAGLAEQIGRDHTTISRQLSKLASLSLISREAGGADRRVRTVTLTPAGDRIAQNVTAARRRLLSAALRGWSEGDLGDLARLSRRFVDTLASAAREPA
jgi:DNA-binding MarR family transcriptional regulator